MQGWCLLLAVQLDRSRYIFARAGFMTQRRRRLGDTENCVYDSCLLVSVTLSKRLGRKRIRSV